MDIKALVTVSRTVEVEMYVPDGNYDNDWGVIRETAERMIAEGHGREIGSEDIGVVSWEKV